MSSVVALPPSIGAGFIRLGESRARHWRPGLRPREGEAQHSEVLAPSGEASGAGAALALAMDHLRSCERGIGEEAEDLRSVLWVQDRKSIRLNGRPYRPGLPSQLRDRIVHVAADEAQDVLFALEEGLLCRDFACVIGELAGNPKELNFTTSRRLSLAAEKHGVPLWLVRHDAARDLSSARMRWEVRSERSPAAPWNASAPGTPSWRAELFRSRTHTEGEWILRDDTQRLSAQPVRQAYPVGLAFAAGGRSLAAG